jgi:membrane associated rhomboid family serine protease
MKSILRAVSLIFVLGFAFASLLQFANVVIIPGVPTAALVGGFVVSCVLALISGDYARKPAFRVRRAASESPDAGPTVNRPPGQAPDWTYTTRSK